MNLFEEIIYKLKNITMERTTGFSPFLLVSYIILIFVLVILFKLRNKYNEKQLKKVLTIYVVFVIILGILKQLIMSYRCEMFCYWEYNFSTFPFQYCTIPMYFALLSLFLKKCKLRDYLLSFIAYFSLLGSIAAIIFAPFGISNIIVISIHTIILHFGSFALSIYLIINNEVKPDKRYFIGGLITFLIAVIFAYILDIVFYNLNITGGREFNMFFISPYYNSGNSVMDYYKHNYNYIVFITCYLIFTISCAYLFWFIHRLINKKRKKSKCLN